MRRHAFLAAMCLVQGVLIFILSAEHRHALVDDAFISFRYADRWAHGEGWTWQDGARVEGFSNPLWTYVLGFLAKGGVPPHEAAVPLGVAAALAATVWVHATLRRLGAPRTVKLLATAGIGMDLGLNLWSASGLETAAAACLIALLLRITVDPPTTRMDGVRIGLCGALLLLVRPEAGLWWAWMAIWLIWIAWVPGRVLLGFALGTLPAALAMLFRWRSSGSPVSNTFFAKLEPSFLGWDEGIESLGIWILAHAAWIAVLPLAALMWRKGRGSLASRWPLLLAGFLLAEAFFVVMAGGDWMGRLRYLAPVLPALYLLGGALLVVFRVGLPAWAVTTLLCLHLGLGWALRDRIPTYTAEGELLGTWLARTAAPDDTLATTASGAIPYYSGLPTIDVLGLNDASVRFRPPRHRGAWAPGHHRYDVALLLDRAPRWIVWDFGVAVNRRRMRTYRDETQEIVSQLDYRRELFAHGKFQALYEVDTSAPPNTQRAYTVFRRRD